MKQLVSFLSVLVLCAGAQGSWYWPFSSDEEKPPRVSELMEPASILIDEAYDLAADGKTSEAVDKFREALRELDRVELENPERVQEPEFNTLKNKRATVTAAIDSLLLGEAQNNAKPIAVSDTTELQKKYDEKHGIKPAANAPPEEKPSAQEPEPVVPEKRQEAAAAPKTEVELAMESLKAKDFDAVGRYVEAILDKKPNDPVALNLRAAAEIAQGNAGAAEKALDQAIMYNPRNYFAYYNMARLMLRSKGNADAARRYYETGRAIGGPLDPALEGLIK